MPTSQAFTGSSALIQAADKGGESTARSSMDTVAGANGPQLKATTNPQQFLQESTDIANDQYSKYGIADAMAKAQKSGSQAATALNFVAEQNKQTEMKNVPVDAMNAEVERLTSMKFRVLPDMLARTDITDYKTKLALADQITAGYDNSINAIITQKQQLETAAENRAKLVTDQQQTQANIFAKQADSDQKDLSAKIDLFKDGRATLNDILQHAVTMAENNQKAKKAGTAGANPFYNPDAAGMNAGGFNDAEVTQFLYFEKYGDFLLDDTSKLQQKPYLLQRYKQWVANGKPTSASSVSAAGPSIPGHIPTATVLQHATDANFKNPFEDPAKSKKAAVPFYFNPNLFGSNPDSGQGATIPPAQ